MQVTIQLSKNELSKLEELTGVEPLIDVDGEVSEDLVSYAISVMISNC